MSLGVNQRACAAALLYVWYHTTNENNAVGSSLLLGLWQGQQQLRSYNYVLSRLRDHFPSSSFNIANYSMRNEQ